MVVLSSMKRTPKKQNIRGAEDKPPAVHLILMIAQTWKLSQDIIPKLRVPHLTNQT